MANTQDVAESQRMDRLLMWRRVVDDASMEQASVTVTLDGIALSGTVLAVADGKPLSIEYRLLVDSAWRSRSLDVWQNFEGMRRSLRLVARPDLRWWVNGRECRELTGCIDVDLSLSPITNALPINRLRIAPGRAAETLAAWVSFPTLKIEPARQRYDHVTAGVYKYSNLASGFTAAIRVDDHGFPLEYEGVWRRIAIGRPMSRAISLSSPVHEGFVGALLANGPSPELGEAASVFDFLVGGWSASVRDIDPDGTSRTAHGEWWFSWVLEGRAMQDVWISPARKDRGKSSPPGAANNRYGTTLRRFDRAGNEWKIVWINPVSGAENHLRGGRDSDGITLVGEDEGMPIRWRFINIRDDAFVWQGYRLSDDRLEWKLQAEFRLHRIL
jgi:hypothetical protein